MNVLSISLDGSISDSGSDVHSRQREYARHFDRYVVVTKTEAGTDDDGGQWGALRVLPTASRSRYTFPFDAYRIAARYCKRNPIDVVTTQDPFATGLVGWLLKRRFGFPLCVQVHTDFLDNANWRTASLQNRVYDHIGRFVLPRADAVRVGTEYVRMKLAEILPTEVGTSVAPVRMRIDELTTDVLSSELTRLRSRLDIDDRPVVSFVGRIVEAKDLKRWLEVAAQTQSVTAKKPVFLVIGEGPQRDDIEQYSQELGISKDTRFVGWVESSELGAYYQLSDVFLITSKYEGTSRVIVEAGMNELPVVATPFAGAHDNIIHGETGFVEDTNSGLADRVAWLLDKPEESRKMGAAAREYLAKRFDPDELVNQYVQFLRAAAKADTDTR